MEVGLGHWVFAALFAIGFAVLLIFSYRDDLKRTPWLFKGSGLFLLAVFLIVMTLIVLKILHRAGSF